MSIKRPSSTPIVPGAMILASDIEPMRQVTRALAQAVGDGMSLDSTAVAIRRLGRRLDDVAVVRVLGRAQGVGLDGLWEWEEVGLANRKTPPLVYEWRTLKRSSALGHGLLWLQDMQGEPGAGARGHAHLSGQPVLAVRLRRQDTEPFWYGIPAAPPVQRPFMGRVQSFQDLAPNRWTYLVHEVERRLLLAVEQWVDTTTQVPAGRAVEAFCLAEENNSASGVQGHGVNVTGPGFPPGFSTQPIPVGSIVVVYPVTVRPAQGAAEATRHWFERTNGVDGTCGG